MRQLSLVELDLVIGGYSASGDYSQGDSSVYYAEGNFQGEATQADVQAVSNQYNTAGISIEFEFETPKILGTKAKIKGKIGS